MCGSEIGWDCFPLSLGETRGVEKLPEARLTHLRGARRKRKREQAYNGGRRPMLWWQTVGTPYLPFSDGLRWRDMACTLKSLKGFRKKKGKERKDICGKNEQGLLSFPQCRQLISCSDLLLISKGVSQPKEWKRGLRRKQDEHQVRLVESSFNPDVWQCGDKTSDALLLCRLNLRIHKRSSFALLMVSHASLAVWYQELWKRKRVFSKGEPCKCEWLVQAVTFFPFLQAILYLILSHFEISPWGLGQGTGGYAQSVGGIPDPQLPIHSLSKADSSKNVSSSPFTSPLSQSLPSAIFKRKPYLLLILHLTRECCSGTPPSRANRGTLWSSLKLPVFHNFKEKVKIPCLLPK